MKVVLVNGSPNAGGCTFTGLSIIKEQLAKHGVDSEIFQAGKKPNDTNLHKYHVYAGFMYVLNPPATPVDS